MLVVVKRGVKKSFIHRENLNCDFDTHRALFVVQKLIVQCSTRSCSVIADLVDHTNIDYRYTLLSSYNLM